MENNSKKAEYWQNVASKQKKLNKSLTHSDIYMPLLETNSINSLLHNTDEVLEIGCGGCDNSINYMKKVKTYTGVELIKDFVDISNTKIQNSKIQNSKIVNSDGFNFISDNEFQADKLITQRFIINLKDREMQIKFFKNVHKNSINRHLELIICEGFIDELNNLNTLRKEIGLHDIKVAEYNNFFDKSFIDEVLSIGFELIEEIKFNTYYFISRIFNTEAFNPTINVQELAYHYQIHHTLDIKKEISYTKILKLKIK